MAKFIYRMQNILNLKYKLEEQAKTAFGLAQRKLLEEEQKLEEQRKQKEEYLYQLKSLMKGSLDVRRLTRLEHAVEDVKEQMKLQKIRILDAEHKVEQARERLKEAMIERKTQEKLRENAFEEFKEEINQQEKKEVDELVSYKYSQREAESMA